MKRKSFLLLLVQLLLVAGLYAQHDTPASANETLVVNENSVNDDSSSQYVQSDEAVPVAANEAEGADSAGAPLGDDSNITAIVLLLMGVFVLYIIIKNIRKNHRNQTRTETVPVEEAEKSSRSEKPGEVYAAIAAALYSSMEEEHDDENAVLTIRRVERTYSPWSSKIYGLREIPRR